MRPLPLTDGRFAVPGNRWDLLADRPAAPTSVAVIVPYYEQPRQLALVLAALRCQTHPAALLEVVVADDGSSQAPDVGLESTDAGPRVRLVRQPDLGFRAAAARNLGVAASTGDVLCFLDADTVPEPHYVERLTRLPSLLPDALCVGRRRHADLSAVAPGRLAEMWCRGERPAALPEPDWLAAEYRRTGDLLDVDHRSYRYLISAVMCCSRILFDDVGGFDESFADYGGEDWEFAYRAMAGGAVVHHVESAVAWHDGPDWSGRVVPDRAAVKNREALAVARLIPDEAARVPGLRYDHPAVAVTVDTAGHTEASLLATVGCVLDADVGIWLSGPAAPGLLAALRIADERLAVGPVPADVTRRCRLLVTIEGRATLPRSGFAELLRLAEQPGVRAAHAAAGTSAVHVETAWAHHRRARWSRGTVRFADPASADDVGRSVAVAPDAVGLVTGPAQPDLSW